jgi:hypothetical protein
MNRMEISIDFHIRMNDIRFAKSGKLDDDDSIMEGAEMVQLTLVHNRSRSSN